MILNIGGACQTILTKNFFPNQFAENKIIHPTQSFSLEFSHGKKEVLLYTSEPEASFFKDQNLVANYATRANQRVN